MSNPATLLADLLAEWHVPSRHTAERVRNPEGRPELDFWRSQGHAVGLLTEIEQLLAGIRFAGKDISHYEEALPAWYKAVFGYSAPWQNAIDAERALLAASELRELRGLGTLLDTMGLSVTYRTVDRSAIGQALVEVRSLIDSSRWIPDPAKNYMLGLLAEVERCLDNWDDSYAWNLRHVTVELSGALTTAAESELAPEEDKPRFRDLARKVGIQSFTNAATNVLTKGGDQAFEAVGQVIESL